MSDVESPPQSPRKQPASKPGAPEAQVDISFLDVRYGMKSLTNPEITTVYKGSKISFKLPAKEPLHYDFAKVEEEMIFKMAVNTGPDLIGFLYLEIPHRFKALKNFKLDDWFPIKQLETDNVPDNRSTFTAHVKIDYNAVRKLSTTNVFNGKVPKQQVFTEMAKSLKERIKEIHKQIDNYNDEGFRYLHNFEKQLLERKEKIKEMDREKIPSVSTPQKNVDFGKHKVEFYRQQKPGEEKEVATQIEGAEAQKLAEASRSHDALVRELTHTRKELIDTQQRIRSLQEGRYAVDNQTLKHKLDTQLADLQRDKRELALKLAELGNTYEAERNQLEKNTNTQVEKLEAENEKMSKTKEDLLRRKKELDTQLSLAADKEKALTDEEQNLRELKRKLEETEESLRKEEAALMESFDEQGEIKQRMVIERQKIYEEAEQYSYKQADIDLREKQLSALERHYMDEREKHDEKLNKHRDRLEKAKREVQAQREHIEKERLKIDQQRKELDNSFKDLAEEKRNLKADGIRVWREKAKLQEDLRQFKEYQMVVEEDDKKEQKEFDQDYIFLEEQLNLLEKNRAELSGLKDALRQYEKFLEEEQKLQLDQADRFATMQKQFFDKLKHSQFDLTELRAFSAKFANEMQYVEDKLKKNEQAQAQLESQKNKIRASIFANHLQPPQEIVHRKTVLANMRQSKVSRVSASASALQVNLETHFKAGFQADKLLERVFDKVCLRKTHSKNVDLEKELERLRGDLDGVEEELSKAQFANKQLKLSLFVKNKAAAVNAENSTKLGTAVAAQPVHVQQESDSLQQDTLDLFTVTTQQLKDSLGSAKDPQKVQARIAFVEDKLIELNKIFHNLNMAERQMAEGKAIDFDFTKLKAAYEKKIKFLTDYITKIRENYEFFNNEVDNEILTS